jgi:outer membrane protein TolC
MTRRVVIFVLGFFVSFRFSLHAETAVSPDAVEIHASVQSQKLTLRHCLEIAAQSNPDLLQASTGFTDAEGQAIKLHAILYPRMQVAALAVPPTIYVQVDQFLYNHAIGPQIELSRLTRDQAVLNYQQTLIEIVFRIRQDFALALAQQGTVDALQRNLDHYQDMITSAQQLFDAGKIQQGELLQLRVRSNLARQRLETAHSTYHQALLQLEMLLGQKLGDATQLQGFLGEDAIPELNIKKLTLQALQNRPDLQVLASQKMTQGQKIALSTQAFYPTLSIGSNSAFALPFPVGTGGYDINRNFDEIAAQRPNGNSQIPLSIYFFWTFFDGGKSWGLKQSGEAQLTSQEEALSALKNAIPGEIEEAVDTLQNAEDSLKALAAAPTAEQLRTNADLDFNAGRIHLLDKSLIEDSILQQEQADLDARLKVSLTAAALDHVLGHVVQFASTNNS